MAALLPLALLLLSLGVLAVAVNRRSERPSMPRLLLAVLLAAGGGFLLGFLVADVETSYYRSLLRGVVRATADALGTGEAPGDAARVRDAYRRALEDSDRGEDFAAGWKVVRMLEDLPEPAEPDQPTGSP